MVELREEGAIAFSDDGNPVMNALLMRRALEYALIFKGLIISHCENSFLSADGVINEGYISTMTGLKGIPTAAEEIMVARDIILSKMTGSPIHIAHVSAAGSVALIRQAKKEGVPVTAEVTPHHFSLSEKEVLGFDTNTKVNPPLRNLEDIEALIEGLKDDTIDVITSDHAPHTIAEKEQEFNLAPFGMIGLETLLPISLTYLYHQKKLNLETIISKLTYNPAQILQIPAGTLTRGASADLCIIDPEKKFKVDKESLFSKAKNTPFHGRELIGAPVMTIRAGKIIHPKRDQNLL